MTSIRAIVPRLSQILSWMAHTFSVFGTLLTSVLVVLFLAFAALHLYLVPNLGDYKNKAEQYLSEQLKQTVHIGSLSATSHGVVPDLQVSDFSLTDASGKKQLSAKRIDAELSLTSLWRAGLSRLQVDGLELAVIRKDAHVTEVAGIAIDNRTPSDPRLTDWIFSQPSLIVKNATLHWTDRTATRQEPYPLTLSGVNLGLTNSRTNHDFDIALSPPAQVGDRVQVLANFTQPLISLHPGDWKKWLGKIKLVTPQIQVDQLLAIVQPELGLRAGVLRGTTEIQIASATVKTVRSAMIAEDLVLDQLRAEKDGPAVSGRINGSIQFSLDEGKIANAAGKFRASAIELLTQGKAKPLQVSDLSGSYAFEQSQGSINQTPRSQTTELALQDFRARLASGEIWQGKSLYFTQNSQGSSNDYRVKLDQIALSVVSAIAQQLPLDEAIQKQLAAMQLQGVATNLDFSGRRSLSLVTDKQEWSELKAEGKIAGLGWRAYEQIPGLQGLDINLSALGLTGKAELSLKNAALQLPETFGKATLALQALNGLFEWDARGDALTVQSKNLMVASPDLSGTADLVWQKQSKAVAKDLGNLILNAKLNKVELRNMLAFLPQTMDGKTRETLNQSLRTGTLGQTELHVKGDLNQPEISAKGSVTGLAWSGFGNIPGVMGGTGVDIQFDVQGKQGKATLALQNSDIDLPQGQFSIARFPLQRLAGTVLWNAEGERIRLQAQDLAFHNADFQGKINGHWQSGSSASETDQYGQLDVQAQLEKLELSKLLTYLPKEVDAATQKKWRDTLRAGTLQKTELKITGDMRSPSVQARGSVRGLAWNTFGDVPGLSQVDVDFDALGSTGTAKIRMRDGVIDVPQYFDEAKLPIQNLTGTLEWDTRHNQIQVKSQDLVLSNADLSGKANLLWRINRLSKDPKDYGYLDLKAHLDRAEAKRVYRYLPKSLDAEVRKYVQNGIQDGALQNTQFVVQGPVYHMPSQNAKFGIFNITTQLRNGVYAYVPAYLTGKDGKKWPALEQLNADLQFTGTGLKISKATSKMAGSPHLLFENLNASIEEYQKSIVKVSTQGKGPAQEVLDFIRVSPLSALLSHSLDHSTASGDANYQFQLEIPIAKTENTKVTGKVALQGNTLTLNRSVPVFEDLRGTLFFTEKGFDIKQGQIQILGGPLRFDGGLLPTNQSDGTANTELRFNGRGTFTAEALRESRFFDLLTNLGGYLNGSADYELGLRMVAGSPEISFKSNLEGMESKLPEPLAKPASTSLPVEYRNRYTLDANHALHHEDMDVRIGETGEVLKLHYLRDVSKSPATVLKGSIGVGLAADENAPELAEGVGANIVIKQVNVSTWQNVIAALGKSQNKSTEANEEAPPTKPDQAQITLATQSYLPNVMVLRTEDLTVMGRKIHHLIAGGERQGGLWKVNIQSDEAVGYAEYQQAVNANEGRVFTRLDKLHLGAQDATQVRSAIEDRPNSLPDLDILVADLLIDQYSLGKMEVLATNQANALSTGDNEKDRNDRVWQIQTVRLSNPDATLMMSGNWALQDTKQGAFDKKINLNFNLDATDAGNMLTRLKLPNVLSNGNGTLTGQISWTGSPFLIHYADLNGSLNFAMQSGQLLKVDPGAARLLGLLSLQFLPRLLTFDLRSEVETGFAFDTFEGDFIIDKGTAKTDNLTLQNKSLARVELVGETDIAQSTQNVHVKMVPLFNLGSAAVAAGIVNPALWTALPIQWIVSKVLASSNTKYYHLSGSWDDPKIEATN